MTDMTAPTQADREIAKSVKYSAIQEDAVGAGIVAKHRIAAEQAMVARIVAKLKEIDYDRASQIIAKEFGA